MPSMHIIYLLGNADARSMRLRTLLGYAGLNVLFRNFQDAEKECDSFKGGLCFVINAASEEDCAILNMLRARGYKAPAIIVSEQPLSLSPKFSAQASILTTLHGGFSDGEFLFWIESAITARLMLKQMRGSDPRANIGYVRKSSAA